MFKTITKAVALAAVAGGLNLAVVAPASAETNNHIVGRRCSFSSVTDPTIENGETQTGQINGGPIGTTTVPGQISMKCTIQVSADNSTHLGVENDSCSASSQPSPQVTAVPPTLCSYLSPEGQPVFMCTEVTVNGVKWYWDATVTNPGPPETVRGWTTDPNAKCNEAISQEILPGPLCNLAALTPGVPGIIDIGPDGDLYIAGIWFTDCKPYDNPLPAPPGGWFPDPVICPELAKLAGTYGPVIIDSEGDIYIDADADGIADHPDELWWNCPPYSS